MDFRKLPTGLYRIDVFLEKQAGRPDASCDAQRSRFWTRASNRRGRCPRKPLPASRAADASVQGECRSAGGPILVFLQPAGDLLACVPGLAGGRLSPIVRARPCTHRAWRRPSATHIRSSRSPILPGTKPSSRSTPPCANSTDIELGVSLYGEPTYGTSFFNWLDSSPHKHYGVTEFHPLKAMDPKELGRHAGKTRRPRRRVLSRSSWSHAGRAASCPGPTTCFRWTPTTRSTARSSCMSQCIGCCRLTALAQACERLATASPIRSTA